MSKKRKRHEHDDESAHIATNALNDAEKTSEEDSVLLGAQEIENVRKKLHYCGNLVSRALKKACGFEVQKIIKRMKTAREEDNSGRVVRLERELQLAKTLNHHIYAEYHLHKTLLEDELFRSHPDLVTDHERPPIPQEDRDLLTNLLGRLYSTAVVKSAMTTSLNIIHRAAGIENTGNQGIRSSKHSDRLKRSSDSPSVRETKSPSSSLFIRSDAPIPEGVTSEEEEEESENATDFDQEESPNVPQKHVELDESKDEAEDDDRHLPVKTTFLPSLSAGYIPASDDSDPDEELESFAPMKQPRKNRRGQRERRGIWEKKYGKNAHHLQKETQKATPLAKDRKRLERKPQKGESEAPRDSNLDRNVQKETKISEPHPSWTAKQKMREQQKAMLASVKPQKIKFE